MPKFKLSRSGKMLSAPHFIAISVVSTAVIGIGSLIGLHPLHASRSSVSMSVSTSEPALALSQYPATEEVRTLHAVLGSDQSAHVVNRIGGATVIRLEREQVTILPDGQVLHLPDFL